MCAEFAYIGARPKALCPSSSSKQTCPVSPFLNVTQEHPVLSLCQDKNNNHNSLQLPHDCHTSPKSSPLSKTRRGSDGAPVKPSSFLFIHFPPPPAQGELVLNGVDTIADGGENDEENDDDDCDDDVALDHGCDVGW